MRNTIYGTQHVEPTDEEWATVAEGPYRVAAPCQLRTGNGRLQFAPGSPKLEKEDWKHVAWS